MTHVELQSLAPWFDESERYQNGKPVDWTEISYHTMFWLKQLRERLDSPIWLIRGPHPNRPEAVDACCPGRPLGQVHMELTRIQRCSWGVYSGNSFHLDTREFEYLPKRWMAVKPEEETLLKDLDLLMLINSRQDGWLYLTWSHPKAFQALKLVIRLAEAKAGAA